MVGVCRLALYAMKMNAQSMPQSQQSGPDNVESKRSYIVHWILSYFLGSFGIDRMYRGLVGTGVLKLVTLGGFGVWYWIDWLMAGFGSPRDKQGLLLAGYTHHKKTMSIITGVLVVLQILFIVPMVLLIVFLSIPALRQNTQNAARHNDVSLIASSISEYRTQAQGQLPVMISGDEQTNAVVFCGTGCKDSVSSPSLGYYSAPSVLLQQYGADMQISTDPEKVLVVGGATCSDTAVLTEQRDNVAILYYINNRSPEQQCLSLY